MEDRAHRRPAGTGAWNDWARGAVSSPKRNGSRRQTEPTPDRPPGGAGMTTVRAPSDWSRARRAGERLFRRGRGDAGARPEHELTRRCRARLPRARERERQVVAPMVIAPPHLPGGRAAPRSVDRNGRIRGARHRGSRRVECDPRCSTRTTVRSSSRQAAGQRGRPHLDKRRQVANRHDVARRLECRSNDPNRCRSPLREERQARVDGR
jgi:hypothetical protein